MDKLAKSCYVNVKVNKLISPTPSGEPAPNHDKVNLASKPCSTKKAAKTNDVPYRTRSGREVCKPPHYKD